MLGESLRERFGEPAEVGIRQQAVKLLTSETRMSILRRLSERRMTVSELARSLELNKSTVHEHLGKMVEGGLLRRDASVEREWVYYELTRTGRYVLHPASARFVLLPAVAVVATLVGLLALHLLLAAPGLAMDVDDPVAPAGEARAWTLDVERAGLFGMPVPVPDAQLYLLTPDQVVQRQLTKQLPTGARPLGAADDLSQVAPGHYAFRASLEPGTHYLLALAPGGHEALSALRGVPVTVEPRNPTVLHGIDASLVEVDVRFEDQPVAGGVVKALDGQGRELAQAQVLAGKALLPLDQPADEVRFRFQPAAPGSAFAEAAGTLHAPRAHVAFEPAAVPLLVASQVRVVVDDPLQGPRAGAPLTLVGPHGKAVAQGITGADGAGILTVRILEPGDFIVRAGDVEVGRLAAMPGLRLWVEPGPHQEGEGVRVRSLLLGAEPFPVGGASVYVDDREVGTTDEQGWLTLEFGMGGSYALEARRAGHLPAAVDLDVLATSGYLPYNGKEGFAAALGSTLARATPDGPGLAVAQGRVPVGQATEVRARLVNGDALPRVLRADLVADGQLVATQTAQVAPGEAADFTFDYAPDQPGVHQVQVNDLPAVPVEAVAVPASTTQAASVRPAPGLPDVAALAALALAALAAVAARRR